jgi:crotonobetainyl-CoA:carnitine CoA-transferase CaiB-like acyl-CoA transferase
MTTSEPCDRGDVDNRSTAHGFHLRNAVLGHEHHRLDVDAHRVIPFLDVNIDRVASRTDDADIVHKNVHPTELCDHLANRSSMLEVARGCLSWAAWRRPARLRWCSGPSGGYRRRRRNRCLLLPQRLIMVRISGYGQSGSSRHLPGFARIAQAYAGLTYLAGEPDGPPLTPGSTSLADYSAGLFAAFGVMVALQHRTQTGVGQQVELGLYEAMFRLMDSLAVVHGHSGEIRGRLGRFTSLTAPHGQYAAANERWIAIACNTDAQFASLARVLGAPELAEDPRFLTAGDRSANRHVLNATIDGLIAQHSVTELVERLSQAQVPAGPVNSIADIFADPLFWERGNLLRHDSAEFGRLTIPGPVPHLSETPAHIDWVGSGEIGQHNQEVYGGLLGLSADEIGSLRERGIV